MGITPFYLWGFSDSGGSTNGVVSLSFHPKNTDERDDSLYFTKIPKS